ncbi:hypothetical protein HK096_002238 [Nowakowskiella sp. JEL0078]|nr:hypothetical protein HK096_002238 [Nowakowskiella sp. JEL0078]
MSVVSEASPPDLPLSMASVHPLSLSEPINAYEEPDPFLSDHGFRLIKKPTKKKKSVLTFALGSARGTAISNASSSFSFASLPKDDLATDVPPQKIPCKFQKMGNCTAGSKCPFSHERDSSQNLQQLVCMFYVKGSCRYGSTCRLPHIKPSTMVVPNVVNSIVITPLTPAPPPSPPMPLPAPSIPSFTTITSPSTSGASTPTKRHSAPISTWLTPTSPSTPKTTSTSFKFSSTPVFLPAASLLSTSATSTSMPHTSFNPFIASAKPTAGLPLPLFTTGSPFEGSPSLSLSLQFGSPQLPSPLYNEDFGSEDDEDDYVLADPILPSSLSDLLTPFEQMHLGESLGRSLRHSRSSSIIGMPPLPKVTSPLLRPVHFREDGWPAEYFDDEDMFQMDRDERLSYAKAAAVIAPVARNGKAVAVGVVTPVTVISENRDDEDALCPFALQGNCRYGDKCRYVHGIQCPICMKHVLHPNASSQKHEEHIEACKLKQDEIDKQNAAVLVSEDMECVVCMERVMSKRDPRFGLLNCDHCVCLTCIRQWRTNENMGTAKSCPICRETTFFITPSSIWLSDPIEKHKVIEDYKAKLSTIDCKHFNFGDAGASCPFGTSCFYRHVNRDGVREDDRVRVVKGADENATVVSKVRLSDFLDVFDRVVDQFVEGPEKEQILNKKDKINVYFALNSSIHAPRPEFPSGRFASAAVSSENFLCSSIASGVLRDGGSGVDAAIAACVCIGVTNSYSAGIGGGGFLLVRDANGNTAALDFRETAPGSAWRDMFVGKEESGRIGVTGESRGYAFIEFSNVKESHRAYRSGNGMLLEGRNILVDFERSRTMEGWVPRRLGGGLGGRKESGQLRFGGRERPFKRPIYTGPNFPSEIPNVNKYDDGWRINSLKRSEDSDDEKVRRKYDHQDRRLERNSSDSNRKESRRYEHRDSTRDDIQKSRYRSRSPRYRSEYKWRRSPSPENFHKRR